MITNYTPQRRPSWRGVLAGLLMGLVVVMAMIALALVLASFLPFSLQGSSIAAGVYAIVTALVSAYVAGHFAVKYSAPETLFGDGTEIDEKDATLTGMLTAACILVLSSLLTLSSATSILSTATTAATSTVGAVASTTASVAGTAVSVGTTAAGAASTVAAGTDFNLQQEVQTLYNRVTGDVSRGDIEGWVAQNTQGLDRDQINASVNVIENMVNANKNQMAQLDFTSLETWRNLDTIAANRLADVEQTLTSDEIIRRLQNQGLTQAQAQEVRNEVTSSYNTYKTAIEQRVAAARQEVDAAIQKAEDYARKAALYAGLFWLISALLTFLAAIMGARGAAANYKLDKPIIRMGDNVR